MPGKSKKKRRREPPDVRRKQILKAAMKLVLKKGFGAMTMSDVASKAGLGKGTIYLYYPSKPDILAGLQRQALDSMMDEARELISDRTLSWTERLDGLVDAWLRWDVENADVHHALFHEHNMSSMGDELFDACTKSLVDILSGGVAAEEFVLDDVRVTARFLIHGYSGVCFHCDGQGDSAHKHDGCHVRPKLDSNLMRLQLQHLFRRTVGATPQ